MKTKLITITAILALASAALAGDSAADLIARLNREAAEKQARQQAEFQRVQIENRMRDIEAAQRRQQQQDAIKPK